MFETVAAQPPDPILGLSDTFQQDARPEKINLTIGVYRDEQGQTAVLGSVKAAERKLLENETTKGYLGIDGLQPFTECARDLTLGGLVPDERVAAFQSPGGTGALRIAADFLAANFHAPRVWISKPTWPNHNAIFEAAGFECLAHPYLAANGLSLDFSAMMDALQRDAKAGDVICLHACCHNPSGVDLDSTQWDELAEFTAKRGVLPLLDFAYHGFGDGLEEDRVALIALAKQHAEFLVCSSYSKNFGLYSERVGAMLAVCPSTDSAAKVSSSVKRVIRSNYSNPPRHGGAIVATILQDDSLKSQWLSELTAMRTRIHSARKQFVDGMQSKGAATDFSFLLEQRGMFSFSGLNPMQVDWLRKERAVYMVGSGRINVAGITPSNLDYLTTAIADAIA